MTVATEITAERFYDITAGAPISTAIPATSENDVQVYYGIDSFQAIRNVDYTVSLVPPFNTIRVTPLTLFIEKINNLIADDPEEINAITIRREKDYLTSATPDFAKSTRWVSAEFDATAMRFAQLNEKVNRSIVLAPTFVGGTEGPALQLNQLVAGTALVVNGDGTALEAGPLVGDIANAQQAALDAIAAAAAAQAALASISATVLSVLNGLPNRPDGSIAGLAVDQWFISGGFLAKVQP